MNDPTPETDFSSFAALIQERRTQGVRLVNVQRIDLYWELGKRIHHLIDQGGWGRGTVSQLADYLNTHSPGLREFSASNLWRMRQFYQTWRDVPEKLAPLMRELPWSAHLDLMGRCKTNEERNFYLVHSRSSGVFGGK